MASDHRARVRRVHHAMVPVLRTQVTVAAVLAVSAVALFTFRQWLAGGLVATVAVVPVAAMVESVVVWFQVRRPSHWPDQHYEPFLGPAPKLPAGTHDQPPLPVEQLDRRAWTILTWRQGHLPLRHLRRTSDWQALWSLEQREVWRIAARLGLEDDQRYSLLSRHGECVRRLAHEANPSIAESARLPKTAPMTPIPLVVTRRRIRRAWLVPRFMAGWSCWFGNRRAEIGAWLCVTKFRFVTRSAYQRQPPLHS